jgi:hypothetical protein
MGARSALGRASLTQRARVEICRRVGQDAASVAAVAREFGIGWHTAMTAVRDYGTPRVDDPTRLAGVEAIGVDETAFAASATRSTSFLTGIVDLTGGVAPPGCSTWWRAGQLRRWSAGSTTATRPGVPTSAPPRWTPTAAMPAPCAACSATRCACWMPST